ncbi:MAG: Gfo/Idh/MocA family oxidoreductase [Lachnospiraceae bacterium]|nr:Gfo/Idh/MocA family oxidoreductase [Lachnospiraceae bacterium]
MTKEPIRWAVLGCGVIANEMAAALCAHGRRMYGVANRTHEKAVAFAEKYGVEKVYDSIDGLFSDPAAEAVYITTPHNTHYGFIKKALENGKHVLAEKSITLNSGELDELAKLAEGKGLMLGEAMTIWHMPLYQKLREIVESGEYGKVQMITLNFGSFKEYDMSNRFFDPAQAGGALLDIGVYALSIVRGFMTSAPDQIRSQWKPAPTGVDEMATILLKNEEGQMAAVALSLHSKQPKRAMISLEKGYLEIMEYPRAARAVFTDAVTGAQTVIEGGDPSAPLRSAQDDSPLCSAQDDGPIQDGNALWYELLDMEEAIRTGDPGPLRLRESMDVMAIMTALRREWGLKYPEE